jgi:uncharacterized protein (DUF2384 family)
MAAIAPLLLDDTAFEELLRTGGDPDMVDPAGIEHEIAASNLQLARAKDIPESVRLFVEDLADDVALLPLDAMLRIDPYLLVALQQSLLASVRALEHPDPVIARRELRIRLEQLRQVYRDLADARPIYEDRAVKQLVRWLVEVMDVPQARLGELFGVSPRTFQRWASENDDSEPAGAEARRVRIVAHLVGHLRHALTGHGAIEWLESPHPRIGGRMPRELLDDPEALSQLTRLAASTRSAIAS